MTTAAGHKPFHAVAGGESGVAQFGRLPFGTFVQKHLNSETTDVAPFLKKEVSLLFALFGNEKK